MRKPLFVLLALLAVAQPARAQDSPALINWFAPPGWLADQRPLRANATLALVVTLNGWENTWIYLAEDWAAVQSPTRDVSIYDYRLRAVVSIGSHAQTNGAPLAQTPLWRLDEFQKLSAATPTNDGACNAEARLGVALPASPFHGNAQLQRDGGSLIVSCGGRVVSTLTLSDDTAALATLWPTLVNELRIHPALAAEMSGLQVVPKTISTMGHNGQPKETFALVAAQTVSVPYPLDDGFRASPHWTFMDPEVEALVDEFVAGKVAASPLGTSATLPPDRFPGIIGEMQPLAEPLPTLVDRVRSSPDNPGYWMDLADYHAAQGNPFSALALVALAHELPGSTENKRVQAWLERLREVETMAPQFFLLD